MFVFSLSTPARQMGYVKVEAKLSAIISGGSWSYTIIGYVSKIQILAKMKNANMVTGEII